ncbi:MAG: WD40 repeat-like protein [Thelocarpon superellum]|nr:MAG: WD40 repeat-like protein [Thelocarpon superellum]
MSIVADGLWAASPSTTRGQPTPLSSDAKGERIAYAARSHKSIFLRSIDTPALSTQYTGHTVQTSVARFAPSGYYVASGDVSGTVRVWDCVGQGATKGRTPSSTCRAGEYHIISGRINDLAWDGDSQRIIAVGDGKERFGHCITADSGNSVGEISGHSSQINAVSVRPQRPLRAATGSDDTSMVFYHGAPFKFNTSLRGQHSNFIYGVAFSPDGSRVVSVGADRKINLYDGKTGEASGPVGAGVHQGSVFAVSWAADSKQFATASADQTVKVWDVVNGKVVRDWRLGDDSVVSVPDHQVGVVWPAGRTDGLIISLSLNGDLNYLEARSPRPVKIVQGHQKSITAAMVHEQGTAASRTLWTGSYDGRVCGWDLAQASGGRVDGQSHTNHVAAFTATPDGAGRIYSTGWDDTIRSIDPATGTFTGTVTKTDGQPKALTSSVGSMVVAATSNGVEIYREGVEKVGGITTTFTPTAIAASQGVDGGTVVAVGADDHRVRIYALSSDATRLELQRELTNATAAITALAFSPTQKHLAAGTSAGKIIVFHVGEYTVATDRWSAHTARVTCLAWDEQGRSAASGGLDTHVFVWSLASPGKRYQAANAHKDGVTGVGWVESEKKIVSAGADAAIKVWKVEGL